MSFKAGITISQDERDLPLFLAIQLYFDCGHLFLNKKKNDYLQLVRIDFINLQELYQIVIPFFEKNTFKEKRNVELQYLKTLVSKKIKVFRLSNIERYECSLIFFKLRKHKLSNCQKQALDSIFKKVGKNF